VLNAGIGSDDGEEAEGAEGSEEEDGVGEGDMADGGVEEEEESEDDDAG